MTEQEKADTRAQGAFANWIIGLNAEMKGFRRSPEYQEQFWASLRAEMARALSRGKVN